MANKLAKLADLKNAIESESTDSDAVLTDLLEAASAMAERIAGVVAGGLRRQADIIEYPRARSPHSSVIGLGRRPIESISTVKLIYGPGTSDDFAQVDALVEADDYYIASEEIGTVGLITDWWRTDDRSNLVIYTAGFADPEDDAVSGQLLPPDDLQRAVITQATQLWNLRRTAGLKGVEAGGASGQLGHAKAHPLLIDAATRYRRIEL